GNTDTCRFNVIVNDVEPPVITCPGTLILHTDSGQCSAGENFCPTQSGFAAGFDPSNWTLTNTNGGNGSVDITNAPLSITLNGSDNGSGGSSNVNYEIPITCNGIIYFHWDYTSYDAFNNSFWDPFGYILNGTFHQLTPNNIVSINGNAAVTVQAGDVFGFSIFSVDNIFGPSVS